MSYLIRILLPDEPGSLGDLAQAFGIIGANIQSVDIVETLPNNTVMDDIVVSLPKGTMADALITAATAVDGVEVDSIRPFTGRVDRRGQIEMLSRVAAQAHDVPRAMQELVSVMPQALTSSWAVVLRQDAHGVSRVAASDGAPGDDGSSPSLTNITEARVLFPDLEEWIPESWGLLDSTLAAAPLPQTDLVLIMGRIGGPDYLATEVEHIGNVGAIVGALLRCS
ncbi:amino acid-binding ACT domain protein [Corynebacterium breve]|uniref:Amino acid-binding ACT domain protein n=1 Tax=Corynebacterium breve TaxID=3049799 RepID=A0ABY8VI62_9CORY|nr:amino acid-binding ACT domain protein [Corynebacterium breve]WIM68661.1 amino acid-binding ACT domain protein [Corynebacterium breve]